jgi:hypothetical protein
LPADLIKIIVVLGRFVGEINTGIVAERGRGQ